MLTEGKILLLACENKSLQGYGLHSRKKVNYKDNHDCSRQQTFDILEQLIHMKYLALFRFLLKQQKLKCRLLYSLDVAIRINKK